ncbi:MAG: type II secretion system protein GspL [Pseudomonadota bacterium]
MSILVVLIPPRPRLGPAAADSAATASSGTEFSYVLSPDGLSVGAQGRCAASLLPRADSVAAVLSDCDVGWHRITLPKAPRAKMRAALVGLLEEALLDEPDATHLALAPGASAGQPTWVAAVHKPWLASHLAVLEKANRSVERVVPAAWPDEIPVGHFSEGPEADGSTEQMNLVWSDAQGVACLRLQGTLARTLLPGQGADAARWTATPAVAAPAERWLGAPVIVLSAEQRALQATRTLWNLRQFDLAPRHRGARALRDAWLRWLSPAWRPVRWGVVGLLALNLVGLNLWAWHQRGAIEAKQQAMVELLRKTYPNVRAVIDAPVQMQRETESLRAAAGKPGENDLEALLQAAASAWPPDRPPVEMLRFEPGRLTLAATGWTPEQVAQFRSQLRPAGWQVEFDAGRLTLTRAAGGAA